MLKILSLPKNKQSQAMYEYEESKYSKTNAYIARWFGFYRIYTGEIGLRILFVITLMFGVWFIRWIIDAFQVSEYINKNNRQLDELLYDKYK